MAPMLSRHPGGPGSRTEQKTMQSVFRVPLKSPKRSQTDQTHSTTAAPQPIFHARRSHKKSRTGCKSCKRRRIKCDENKKGGCIQCQSHGIECDYIQTPPRAPSVILPRIQTDDALDGASPPSQAPVTCARVKNESRDTRLALAVHTALQKQAPSRVDATLTPVSCFSAVVPDHMTPLLHTLRHFDDVTTATMGSHMGQAIIKSCMHTITLDKPYLLHAVNGVAAAHLCHLLPATDNPSAHRQHRLTDAYHWQQGLRLFRDELAAGATRDNMDALISTVMLIGVHQFMLTDPAPDPAQSFVFAPTHDRDRCLRWLTIHRGFQALWLAFGDQMWHSIWSPVLRDTDFQSVEAVFLHPRPGDDVHALFLELCEIDSHTDRPGHALYAPLEYLMYLRHLTPDLNIFNKLVSWVGTMDDGFHRLLLRRDPRALLILAHWLALMTEVRQWWISGRSRSECLAIVTFLMHDSDPRIRTLLRYPARAVGIPPGALLLEQAGSGGALVERSSTM